MSLNLSNLSNLGHIYISLSGKYEKWLRSRLEILLDINDITSVSSLSQEKNLTSRRPQVQLILFLLSSIWQKRSRSKINTMSNCLFIQEQIINLIFLSFPTAMKFTREQKCIGWSPFLLPND